MKKIFIAVVVLLVIVGSAFTLKSAKPGTANAKSKKFTTMYWFVGGAYTGRTGTHAQEKPLSGCNDLGTLHCEDAYDDNDFVNTGDPTSGLKSGATIDDVIHKNN